MSSVRASLNTISQRDSAPSFFVGIKSSSSAFLISSAGGLSFPAPSRIVIVSINTGRKLSELEFNVTPL